MKKSELVILINEAISEALAEFNDAWNQFPVREPEVKQSGTKINDAIGLGVAEGDVGDFEKQVIQRLLKLPKYKNNRAVAQKVAAQISKLAKSGDKRVTEMWMAWESKKMGSLDDSCTGEFLKELDATHSETDMSNPEEKREVEIAREIIKIVNRIYSDDNARAYLRISDLAEELLKIHGVVEESKRANETKRANESLGQSPSDQTGGAIGNDPNDPIAKKLADTRAKEQKSMSDIRKLDGQAATREKRDFSKVKDEERRKQQSQQALAKATKDSEKLEDTLTKKANKI
jgi:hypothetical protein